MLSQHLPVKPLLLHCKLSKRVLAYTVVASGHSQCASPLAGNTGEALPSRKVIHSDTVKMDIFCSLPLLSLQDRRSWNRITESQNCRGWKGPLEIIETNPPAKAGSLHQVAQVGVQARLEYLQRRRLHNLPGQPVPVLRHPHREEVLTHIRAKLPVLQLMSVSPRPVSTYH